MVSSYPESVAVQRKLQRCAVLFALFYADDGVMTSALSSLSCFVYVQVQALVKVLSRLLTAVMYPAHFVRDHHQGLPIFNEIFSDISA